MYEPFTQAIELFKPHPEHTKSRKDFEAFLVVCDECPHRIEMRCPRCRCKGGGKSCIRLAELPDKMCPIGRG